MEAAAGTSAEQLGPAVRITCEAANARIARARAVYQRLQCLATSSTLPSTFLVQSAPTYAAQQAQQSTALMVQTDYLAFQQQQQQQQRRRQCYASGGVV